MGLLRSGRARTYFLLYDTARRRAPQTRVESCTRSLAAAQVRPKFPVAALLRSGIQTGLVAHGFPIWVRMGRAGRGELMSRFGVLVLLLFPALPRITPDAPPVTEPAADGQIVNPADVHMQAGPFSNPGPA